MTPHPAMSTGPDLYGGDPCPVCGVILDYDEFGDERERSIVHPDPDCGWKPSGYPSTRRGWIYGRDPDVLGTAPGGRET